MAGKILIKRADHTPNLGEILINGLFQKQRCLDFCGKMTSHAERRLAYSHLECYHWCRRILGGVDPGSPKQILKDILFYIDLS